MPEPMTMMALASAGSAGTSFLSSRSAAKAQQSASKRAIRSNEILTREERARQDRLLAEQREDFRPWREIGEQALTLINDGIQTGTYQAPVFDADDIDLEQDPGYQFRMEQGQKAMDNAAAARGQVLSGAQLREAIRYGQGVASQEYGNAYARYADQIDREGSRRLQRYNMLRDLSGQGLSAAARSADATARNASTSNALTTNQANRTFQGIIAEGDAKAAGYTGGARAINQGIQNWLTYRTANNSPVTPPPTTGTATNSSNALLMTGPSGARIYS